MFPQYGPLDDIPRKAITINITPDFLRANQNFIFVFGDNTIHKGKGGAAVLRDHPNTYGFITKKYPSNHHSSFYVPNEYRLVFQQELDKLEKFIIANPTKTIYISKIGSGLANKHKIFEKVINFGILILKSYPNVYFGWD